MPRFEITGRANDVFNLSDIQDALRKSGAINVRSRYAFGWSNQPHVATFSANDLRQARTICDNARALLVSDGDFPSLIPYAYKESDK